MTNVSKKLSAEQQEKILETLQSRFASHMDRHTNMDWSSLHDKLIENKEKLWTLNEMEVTGGEPDVVDYDETTGQYFFFDCSAESPVGRRSVCYDQEALESRKKNKPENNALDMANEIGIELLTEEQYRWLQQFGEFDRKTSSWVQTPEDIRKRGGALFCDRRYDQVFLYHNGAESYYAARGFRGLLRL